MRDWSKVTIEDVTSVLGDGLHGTPKYSDNGEYAFINGNNLVNGKIVIKKDTKKVDETQYEKYKKPLSERTLMVSINGTLGNVGEYNGEKIILGKSACYFNIIETVNKNYIKYVISSPYFKDYLERNATGTTIKNISLKQMREYEFLLPRRQIQDKISEFLGRIDRQIEVNEKINNNLLQQAQAIYINMFATNNSMMPATIADVALNVTDGVHNTVHDDPNGKYLLLSCKNIKGGHLNIGIDERTINKEVFDKLRQRTNLAKGDVLISSVGTVGEILMLNTNPSNYEFQRSVAIVKPNPDIVSSAYLFEALSNRKAELINAAHGAVQQCLFISDIAGFPICIPDSKDLAVFDEAVMPMFNIITANESENEKLTSLRDILLPKLMSGELDVCNIQL